MFPTPTTGTIRLCSEVVLYLDTVEAGGRSPQTVAQYRRVISALSNPLTATDLDIRDLLDCFRSVNTRSVYLTILRQFYRFCIGRSLITSDPTRHIPFPKTHRRRWPLISEEEYGRLRDLAEGWLRAFVTVLYRVGSRVTETRLIRPEHVSLNGESGTIDFPRRKGGDAGFAAFGAEVARLVSPRLAGTWVFPDPRERTRPVTYGMVAGRLASLGRKVGMPGVLTAHRFRHSFITNAVDAGWPQLALQVQLGHKNPSSTAHYYHPSRARLVEVYRRLERSGHFGA